MPGVYSTIPRNAIEGTDSVCGIAGFLDPEHSGGDWESVLRAMTAAIPHRGPDDEGHWLDLAAGVALGHRRLSILDLSAEGHQPMVSTSGRYVIVFNGEVYNYRELQAELRQRGHSFKGHSDTEVVLAAFEDWDVSQALKRLVGMFALALWDRAEQALYLARDRVGEKPLYYGIMGQCLLFGSELKSLRAHPSWRGFVDRGALTLQMRHGYVPAPYSIFEGIRKVVPGTFVRLVATDVRERGYGANEPYWSLKAVAEAGVADPFKGGDEEAIERLDQVLRDAVRLQMVADVPLGAFLSGGVDSSTIVALMQAQSGSPVRTFTVGFDEHGFNEAEHARAVATHLGTDHTELYIQPAEALAVIPRLPVLYDEPFSDASQIPTFLVAQLARRHVTVSLSGDAGDELFCGYNRYSWGRSVWNRIGWVPVGVRAWLAGALTAVSPGSWDRAFAMVGGGLPARLRQVQAGDKIHKLAGILAKESPEALFRGLASQCDEPEKVVISGIEPPTALTDERAWASLPDFASKMMYLDAISYLPDDILVKVDRAAMGVSLESRVPFLDHRVVEFAWRLPLSMKIRDGASKWALRQVLYRYVPKSLIERPKSGFAVPIAVWLRGPLRDWAEDLLAVPRLREGGYLDPAIVRQQWQEHLSERYNRMPFLWNVLMFQAWLERYGDATA